MKPFHLMNISWRIVHGSEVHFKYLVFRKVRQICDKCVWWCNRIIFFTLHICLNLWRMVKKLIWQVSVYTSTCIGLLLINRRRCSQKSVIIVLSLYSLKKFKRNKIQITFNTVAVKLKLKRPYYEPLKMDNTNAELTLSSRSYYV